MASTVSGAGSSDVTDVITALGDTQYHTIVCGLADSTNVGLLESELSTRWGPMPENDGHLFVGVNDTHTNSTTYTTAPARNSEQSTVVLGQQSPTPPWITAAEAAAWDAFTLSVDPALPRSYRALKKTLPPSTTDAWTREERNSALLVGGATLKTDAGGNVVIERLTTTYQKTPAGAVDTAYYDLSRKRTVSFLRWDWDRRLTAKYGQFKLANDGTRFAPGQRIVTPRTLRAEAVAWFTAMENIGLVEDLEQFVRDLIVERNTQDANRIDMLLAPNTIDKFVTSATLLQFR